MQNELKTWLESHKHLPPFMRDFHDQKDLFKAIYDLYDHDREGVIPEMPDWIQAHMFTIDWFLWYMASRGYTLQKCRANQEFLPFHKYEPPPIPGLTPIKQND